MSTDFDAIDRHAGRQGRRAMMRAIHRQRGVSIALILSVALTTVVTLVLVAFAILFYRSERQQRWDQLRTSLAVSVDELAVALPTWNFDQSQILAIMRSGLNHRGLLGSAVRP